MICTLQKKSVSLRHRVSGDSNMLHSHFMRFKKVSKSNNAIAITESKIQQTEQDTILDGK